MKRCIPDYHARQEILTYSLLSFRCATGEAWQAIMLSCTTGRMCDKLANKKGFECGSNVAYGYFVSFVFLCSFLVSFFFKIFLENISYTLGFL